MPRTPYDTVPGGKEVQPNIIDTLQEISEELAESRILLGFPHYTPPPTPAQVAPNGDPKQVPFSLDTVEMIAQSLRGNVGDLRRRLAEFRREFHTQLGE